MKATRVNPDAPNPKQDLLDRHEKAADILVGVAELLTKVDRLLVVDFRGLNLWTPQVTLDSLAMTRRLLVADRADIQRGIEYAQCQVRQQKAKVSA